MHLDRLRRNDTSQAGAALKIHMACELRDAAKPSRFCFLAGSLFFGGREERGLKGSVRRRESVW